MQSRQDAARLKHKAGAAGSELRRIQWDTWSGMFYTDITAYVIILATAVTLNVAGVIRHKHGGSERIAAAGWRKRHQSAYWCRRFCEIRQESPLHAKSRHPPLRRERRS